MKWINTLVFLVLSLSPLVAQTPGLSKDAEIRIVTLGPGQNELYSAFGHSAIRVMDPARNLDIMYNYGVFDYNQPHFYLNFARGYLNYMLERHPSDLFITHYKSEGRYIKEQTLNLDQKQTQKVFDYLQNNYKPENKYYLYDYFYNNCATKVRDAIEEALEGEITFSQHFAVEETTIRDLTDLYLKYQPWGDLGIDICLGMPMDIKATPYMYMFLPDYIFESFSQATIKSGSSTKPLIADEKNTFIPDTTEIQTTFFTPERVFWAFGILLIIVSFREILSNSNYYWIDYIWLFIIGFLGLFLTLLWLATDHASAAWNLNLLWALPSGIFSLFLLKKQSRFIFLYFKVHLILSVLLVIFWYAIPQDLHFALLPIAIINVFRYFTILSRFQNA